MHFAGWNFTTKHLAIKLPGSSLQCVSAFVQELSKQRPYTHAVLYILTTTQADPPIKIENSRQEMRLVYVTLLTLLCLAAESDQLTCHCSSCSTGECTGDYCSTLVEYDLSTGQTSIAKGCLQSSDTSLCGSSGLLLYHCCNTTDYCNNDLDSGHGLGGGTASDSTDGPATGPTVPPVLLPEGETMQESVSTPESTPTPTLLYPPPPTGSPSCFRFDSSDDDGSLRLCSLTANGCYSTLRRTMNGTIVSRRGCSRVPCVNETRNKKVKRCCYDHMCNIDLSIEDYFPISGTTQLPVPEPTAGPFQPTVATERPNTDSSPSPPFRPPVLTPLTSTTSAPGVTYPVQLHCYCRSSNCDTQLCSALHACAVEYVIALGEVVNSTQMCVNDESGCGLVSPGVYRSCCNTTLLCNRHPNLDDIPPEVLGTSLLPTTTGPHTTSHSDTTVTPSHTPTHANIEFTIGTVVLSVFGFVLVLFVVVMTIVCCVKKRRTHKSKAVSTVTVIHATNVQHKVASVECIDSGYHGDREDAGRASVQSTASSSSTPSNEKSSVTHLMTSV